MLLLFSSLLRNGVRGLGFGVTSNAALKLSGEESVMSVMSTTLLRLGLGAIGDDAATRTRLFFSVKYFDPVDIVLLGLDNRPSELKT